MKSVATGLLALSLLLASCTPAPERARVTALYDKYDAHCRQHARMIVGEQEEENRYRSCMNYFVGTDVHCPFCIVSPQLDK